MEGLICPMLRDIAAQVCPSRPRENDEKTGLCIHRSMVVLDSSRVGLIQARVTWEERGSLNSDQTGYDRVGVELSCPLIDVQGPQRPVLPWIPCI